MLRFGGGFYFVGTSTQVVDTHGGRSSVALYGQSRRSGFFFLDVEAEGLEQRNTLRVSSHLLYVCAVGTVMGATQLVGLLYSGEHCNAADSGVLTEHTTTTKTKSGL